MISRRILAFVSCSAIGLLSWPVANGEAASKATVKRDSVAVHAEMSTASKVAKYLRRGDKVTIDLAITGAGGSWCSISEAGQAKSLGFVLCESLEEEPRPRWQEVPSPLPATPPATSPATTQTAPRDRGREQQVLRQVRELKKSV